MSAKADKVVKDSKEIASKKAEPKKAATPKKVEVKKEALKQAAPKKVVPKKIEAGSSNQDIKHIQSGVVVSDKMDKTVVVLVERTIKHSVYGKYITKSSKFFIHDEQNKAKAGDVVRFKACRPYSKNKTWLLVEVI